MSSGARRLWSPDEDEQLRLLVSYWGDQCGKNGNWDKISANFEHRTAKDCRKRWFHSLDPKLKRGRWSDAEDKVLVDAYARLGPSWQRISQLIPGRTDDQCSKRYNDVLDPSAAERLREWDPEEDAKLMALIDEYGTKWREICKFMDGRTGLTCRNRWRKLKKVQETQQDGTRRLSSGSRINSPDEMPHQHPQIGASAAPVPAGQGLEGGQVLPPHHQHGTADTTSYTMGYDNPQHYQDGTPGPGASRQYPISEAELTRILEFCRENDQKIVIHQHIHQHVPPQVLPPAPVGVSAAHDLSNPAPGQVVIPPRLAPGVDFGSPQPDDLFIGGSFANMDYMAFNPS